MSLQYPIPERKAVDIAKLFEKEASEITIYLGGLRSVEVAPLSVDEEAVLRRYIRHVANTLMRISPVLAKNFLAHESFFVKCAQMFKAIVNKPLTIPPSPGSFGVTVIFPQAIKYSTTVPTDYKNNLWEIDLTAGSAAYILGSADKWYYASSEVDKRSMLVIIQDGLIEVGTTPKIYQMLIRTEQDGARGPFAVAPLTEVPIEAGKAIYQYNHPAFIVRHDFGIKWGVMPAYSGTSVLKVLGLVFYEYKFFSDLMTI